MPIVIIKVKTLTPLLMYGAHNKQDSMQTEPRASSFRGILRYWYRAVIGNRTHNPSQLFEQESRVFGSTEQSSALKIRVTHNLQPQDMDDDQVRVMPNRLKQKGVKAGSAFSIRITTHPLLQTDLFDPNSDFTKALFLMCHFGGVGRRARRGSGNLAVMKATGIQLGEYPLTLTVPTYTDLKDFLTKTSHLISPVPPPTMPMPPYFPIFTPDTAVVLLGKTHTHTTYKDAFDELWRVSGSYHHTNGVFGDVRPRRASAIHMRVVRCQTGYVAQQTILYSGRGNWGEMKKYLNHCQVNGFHVLYGDWSKW